MTYQMLEIPAFKNVMFRIDESESESCCVSTSREGSGDSRPQLPGHMQRSDSSRSIANWPFFPSDMQILPLTFFM